MNIEDKINYTLNYFGFEHDFIYDENNPKSVSNIINRLTELYGFKEYLEIGICHGTNIRRLNIENKTGIDPCPSDEGVPYTTYITFSDDYFSSIIEDDKKFDIVLIDGDHTGNQVYRDIKNSLEHLNDNGVILLHDMNPMFEDFAQEVYDPEISIWNGSSWKGFVEARRTIPNIKSWVIRDADFGVGVIVKGDTDERINAKPIDELTYKDFSSNGQYLMNFISFDYFYNKLIYNLSERKETIDVQPFDVQPLVTITITCYNKEKYIKRCIDSIKEQTYDNYECIIINNGSTDNSEDIILKEITFFNKFKLISQENKGVCNSRTTSAFAGKGKYLIQVDGDDVIGKDFIACAVKEMENNNNLGIVYGNIEQINENAQNSQIITPYIPTNEKCEMTNFIFYGNPFHITSLCRLDIFKQIGGFKPEEEEITEDWSMWLRYTRVNNYAKKIDVVAVKRYVYYDSRTYLHNSLNAKLQFANIQRVNKDIYDKEYPMVSYLLYTVDTNGGIKTFENILKTNYKNFEVIFCGKIEQDLIDFINSKNKNSDFIQPISYVDTRGKSTAKSFNEGAKIAKGKYVQLIYDNIGFIPYYTEMCTKTMLKENNIKIIQGIPQDLKSNHVRYDLIDISYDDIKRNPFSVSRDLFIDLEFLKQNNYFTDEPFFEWCFLSKTLKNDFSKLKTFSTISSIVYCDDILYEILKYGEFNKLSSLFNGFSTYLELVD